MFCFTTLSFVSVFLVAGFLRGFLAVGFFFLAFCFGRSTTLVSSGLLGSTKEAIALRKAEINGEIKLRQAELKGSIDTIKAKESAKEKAGKHLAVFGALYLCMMVLAFLGSVTFIPQDNLAIVATLITLVVTSLSGILKGISDTPEPKDPVELMHDIVQKQLLISDKDKK